MVKALKKILPLASFELFGFGNFSKQDLCIFSVVDTAGLISYQNLTSKKR